MKALVFYLPCVCTHTDTEGEQRKVRVRKILKSSEKKTIFNEHPVYTSSLATKPRITLSVRLYVQQLTYCSLERLGFPIQLF